AEDACVAEGVAARLRPDAESVRAGADRNLGEQPAGAGRDRVDDAAVAARQPQDLAVRGHAAHVRAAAAGNPPFAHDLARTEADHRDGAFLTVRRVEHLAVAA